MASAQLPFPKCLPLLGALSSGVKRANGAAKRSDLLELPVIANREATTALLDSGATHNFIARGFAKMCGAVLTWAQPMCVTLATKSHVVSS